MLLFAAEFTSGSWLFQHLSSLPGIWLALLPLLFLPLLALRGRRWRLFCFALWSVSVGFAWSLLYAHVTAPARLQLQSLQEVFQATGQISGIPSQEPGYSRFVFDVIKLESAAGVQQGHWRLRINWYQNAPELEAGARWRLPLRIRPVHGYHNPGSFDLEGWLYAQGIIYQAYVKGEGVPLPGGGGGIHRLRQYLSGLIGELHYPPQVTAVMRALAVGDRSGLSYSDKQVFAATGTSHLMAISGLHIGLVAGLMFWLARRLWRQFPALCARWPDQVAAAPVALVAALAYAALSGFTVSTQRALIMLGVVMLAMIWRRRMHGFDVLGLALLLVMMIQPMSVISPGFWLSFSAVAVLGLLAQRSGWLGAQLGVFVGLSPVLVSLNMDWSLISPLINLLAIPLFAFFVVPLVLTGAVILPLFPALGQWLLHPAARVLEGFLWLLREVAQQAPVLTGGSHHAWMGLLVLFLVLAIPLWTRIRAGWRWLLPVIGALLLLKLALLPSPPRPGSFRFTLLDVGQGLSAVVRTAKHVLVFDTGPGFPSGFNTGTAVIAPYLRNQGIAHVNRLILSHGDNDHIGGSRGLRAAVPVAKIMAGEPAGLGQGQRVEHCTQGRQWGWDGVHFEILYPPDGKRLEGNNASCVLKVSAGDNSVLLTGDIEKEAESWLVQQRPQDLHSSIVVAAHHGSNSSSTPEFVENAHPRWVLYAAGRYNRWGFPKPEVRQRWQAVGARALNTGEQGAACFLLSAQKIEYAPDCWRRQLRYWHENRQSDAKTVR